MTFLGHPAIQNVALVLTLGAVVWYAWLTRRIAGVAVRQADLMHRPYLAIDPWHGREVIRVAMEKGTVKLAEAGEIDPSLASEPSRAELPQKPKLKNLGLGPALAIRVRVVDGGVHEVPVLYPHLAVGQETELVLLPRHGNDAKKWTLEIEYEGVTGMRFVSRYVFEGLVVRDASTAELGRAKVRPT